MKTDLKNNWNIDSNVLYDKPNRKRFKKYSKVKI